MAELLFRSWLPPEADVNISSAGVQALLGHGIDRSSASALGQLGIDPSQHRARQFEPWMAVDADLILTAERAHRDQVMTELPSAFRRTFTMKEFARLSRHVGSGNPKEVIAEIAGIRAIDGPVPEDDDNMPDPYRGRIKQATSIAQQVSATVRATISVLGLVADRPNVTSVASAAVAGATGVPSRPRPLPR
ncbi:MAG: low molecular weight protein-tyrosine phosphatase [Pseudonocardiales bacterium]|jgi:protein-tyrosine phosphatase|nr:wzb [Jatrophihabitans sp.]MDT4927826.1 low molecular weight protein-tyrosine phosphatase [Pseudonocardiales bacterium]MDT4950266.1 low molecular weight protein-tyrosine phosphatase [Pseudonocardiales bacterium]